MIFLFSLLATTPDISNVSSNQASYEDEHLVLQGDVLVDHPLAKMSADKAVLDRQENADLPFSEVKLYDHVLLKLKKSGEILCNKAFFDFNALKGQLLSSDEKVMYSDLFRTKTGQEPLRILSDKVDLKIAKDNEQYSISQLVAKNDVILDWANSYTLLADVAVYEKGNIAAAGKPGTECKLEHDNDLIFATSVALNLKEGLVSLKNARGRLNFLSAVDFSSDGVVWNDEKKTLVLKGNARVTDSTGQVQSTSEITLEQKANVKELASLFSPENVSFQYNPDGNTHSLICPGPFRLDREKLKALFEGKKGLPVQYDEDVFSFTADQTEIDYVQEGKEIRPISVSLKGNVKLQTKGSEEPARCGLCDKLTFFPSTRTVILTAESGKKVLFWDEADSLQISATEVQMTQMSPGEKPTIKGVGNVQFHFNPEEHTLLKQLFPLCFE